MSAHGYSTPTDALEIVRLSGRGNRMKGLNRWCGFVGIGRGVEKEGAGVLPQFVGFHLITDTTYPGFKLR